MTRTTNTAAVTAAVMLATALAALDTTVVGTAMPTIIGSLGGLALYSWVFSSYLLTSTTTVPVYGRLADIYGRRPVFVVGAALFLAGSVLCGAAASMEQLIIFRAVQGLGAGAVLPVSITVVGDIFTVQRRAQIQGLLSSVWAASAIVGPGLGGLIVDHIGWRWVFYVNLPFGLVSITLFLLYLHESVERRQRSVDYIGAVGLTAGLTLLLLGLLESSQGGRGLPIPAWSLLGGGLILLALVLWNQTRVPEPLLPLALLRRRVLAVSYGASLAVGATLLGLSSYVPPFVQGVLGGTAVAAGAALAPMSIGWPVGSMLSGRLILRYGYRPIVLLGTGLILGGSLGALLIGQSTSQPFIMVVMAVVGLGMGFSATSFLVAVQSSVGWGQRGIATAFIQFARSIGGAVGVAAMGSLLNSGLSRGLALAGAQGSSESVAALSSILEPTARAALPAQTLELARALFANSLHDVYLAVVATAAAGLALAALFPRGSVEEHAQAAARLDPDG